MPTYIERQWDPGNAGGLAKRDRRPGRYLAFVPDALPSELPELGAEARRAAEESLTALARADEQIGEKGTYLNHLLVRSESISSSWIEGNRITPKRLAIAEALQTGDRTAIAVIDNVRATESAIAELSDPAHTLTTTDIEVLASRIEPRLPRGLRAEQNWVGGPGHSPLRAEFVPPPAEEVPRLLENLAEFASATEGNAVVRAAIVHAQFETIHPFIDGNGRTGRALIHTVLRRSDAVRNALIPISVVFAGGTDDYIAGLTAFRAEPQRLDDWVIGFARATELAAANAVRLSRDIDEAARSSLERFVDFRTEQGRSPAFPRRGALTLRILDGLAAAPVATVDSIVERYGVSTATAHRALTELSDAGILTRSKDHKGRLVGWSADRYLALASLTERSNRVGGRDTRDERPLVGPPAPEIGQTGPLR